MHGLNSITRLLYIKYEIQYLMLLFKIYLTVIFRSLDYEDIKQENNMQIVNNKIKNYS